VASAPGRKNYAAPAQILTFFRVSIVCKNAKYIHFGSDFSNENDAAPAQHNTDWKNSQVLSLAQKNPCSLLLRDARLI
jgi:hypothetical protein